MKRSSPKPAKKVATISKITSEFAIAVLQPAEALKGTRR